MGPAGGNFGEYHHVAFHLAAHAPVFLLHQQRKDLSVLKSFLCNLLVNVLLSGSKILCAVLVFGLGTRRSFPAELGRVKHQKVEASQ